ncbi:MAG: hypothetical protein LBU14_00675 [Candidatus Peribacteria bacterium]|jgi:hypothetical protein|nr:hypothetical protein [Candidatus Peribacteria bacterium]
MSENDVKDLQTEEISQDWDIGTQDENTQTVEDLDSTSNIETERDNIFDSF